MARDTRLWQDSLACPYVFEGDLTECVKWLAVAKARLQFMLHSTPGATTTTFNPIADVEVRVDARPNRIHIKAGTTLYMETGFLDLLNSAVNNTDTYKPAVLHYNMEVSSYVYSIPEPMQGAIKVAEPYPGKQLPEGYESKAVGCAEKQDAVTTQLGLVLTDGGYCDPEKILEKKKCQSLVPASMFTGKTRLFVQAMYGSTRSDYKCLWGIGPLFDHSILIGDLFFLSPNYSRNTWLLTTSEYKYFIVRYSGFLTFYPLKLSAAGEKLIGLMLANPEFSPTADLTKRIEAYALSTATIDPVHSLVPLDGVAVAGAPFAYGWHTSWNGQEAHIVNAVENDPAGLYENTHYKLLITPQLLDGEYTFTATSSRVENAKNWWPVHQTISLIKPVYIGPEPGMYGVGKVGAGHLFNAPGYDAPVYVTYENDLPVVWRLKYTAQSRTAGEVWTEVLQHSPYNGSTFESNEYTAGASGSFVANLSVLKDSVTVAGARTGDYAELRHRLMEFSTPFVAYRYVIFFNYAEPSTVDFATGLPPNTVMQNEGNQVGSAYPGLPNATWGITIYRSNVSSHEEIANAGSDRAKVFIEIPFQDCDVVFYGSTSQKSPGLTRYQEWFRPNAPDSGDGWAPSVRQSDPDTGISTWVLEFDKRPFANNDLFQAETSFLVRDEFILPDPVGLYTINEGPSAAVIATAPALSNNFHFNVDWAASPPARIDLEPWLSTSQSEYYRYTLNLGGIVDVTKGYASDSAVGWV